MTETPSATDPAHLERLLGIELTLRVTLAEKVVKLEDVINLSVGSLIEFAKTVDDPFDLQVHGRTIARGEAVKSGEHFAFHITEIGSVQDTVRSMGQS